MRGRLLFSQKKIGYYSVRYKKNYKIVARYPNSEIDISWYNNQFNCFRFTLSISSHRLFTSKGELWRGPARYMREALPWDELIVLRDKRSANELIYSICSFVL